MPALADHGGFALPEVPVPGVSFSRRANLVRTPEWVLCNLAGALHDECFGGMKRGIIGVIAESSQNPTLRI
jgi:hypothetical protein